MMQTTLRLGPRALLQAGPRLRQTLLRLAAEPCSGRTLSRRQMLQLLRTLASKGDTGSSVGSTGTYGAAEDEGYSAGDDPELRKNPLLYQALSQNEPWRGAPATSPQLSAHRSFSSASQTTTDSAPAVSTLIDTPAKHKHTQGTGAPATGAARALVKPEVLAPVGGWPQLKAAVENGADCVYFGLTDFNARARASNFTPEELPEVMTYLRDRGVKGYVTLNVLVFDEELPSVEQYIRNIATAGVDAVIVQDLAVVELIRRIAPNLPVHGSTQMSITSGEGAEFASTLGVERVVVGRELSIKEIAKVRKETSAEVEAFVHGALCVSYSGQCFSSEAWGGRSANRGQCAQACRMPYALMVDGQIRELVDAAKYLLSPQDLAAINHVPELILAGVSCFKIEGRLKGPEYVAMTTQVYRRAVDAAWAALTGPTPVTHTSHKDTHDSTSTDTDTTKSHDALERARQAVTLSPQEQLDLEQVFSRGQDDAHRGLTPGFLEGVMHQRLVRGRAPRHRGVYAGKVVRVVQQGRGTGRQTGGGGATRGRERGAGLAPGAAVLIELAAPLRRGDGLVFDRGEPQDKEEGGGIYDLLDSSGRPIREGMVSPKQSSGNGEGAARRVAVVFAAGQIDTARIQPGDLVWRTKDSTLESRLSATWDSVRAADTRKAHVTLSVRGSLGQPLTVVARDEQGREAIGVSSTALEAATQRSLTAADVSKAVGAVGGDGYKLAADVDTSGLAIDQGLFMPVGELKSARRAATEALTSLRRTHTRDTDMIYEPVLPTLLSSIHDTPPTIHTHTPHTTHTWPTTTGVSDVQGANEGAEGLHGSGAESERHAASRKQRAGVVAAGQQSVLRVLCRSAAQVTAALSVPWVTDVVLDFLEVQGLKEAVAEVRSAGRRVTVATPRVLKPDEERLVHFYLRLGADALLVRSTGLLYQLVAMGGPGCSTHGLKGPSGQPLTIPVLEGDFSLNAANVISTDLLLTRGRLNMIAPTHDLSAHQICGLSKALGERASQVEVILHHHLPIFHTEHCVFARFLSDGNSYKDCGHPCERHHVHLRDDKGADHLLLADMGCRNTLFNAAAQSGAFYLSDMLKAGIRHYRVELVDQPAEVVAPLLENYRALLDGNKTPGQVWNWLKQLPDANGRSHGVTPGSLGGLAGGSERDRETMKPTAASLKRGGGGNRMPATQGR